MRKEAAPLEPSRASLDLVTQCAQAIEPRADLRDWYDPYARLNADRIAIDLELVDRFVPKAGSILDVGAIPLLLTVALARGGRSVVGIDVDPSRFAEAIEANSLTVLKCDIEREPLPAGDGSFDAVVLNEVFEHLRIDLLFTFREIRRVLKTGGVLLLSTPNLMSLSGIANLVRTGHAAAVGGDIYDAYWRLEHVGHFGHAREYTPTEVVEFLSKVGFQPEVVMYRGTTNGFHGIGPLMTRWVPRLRHFITVVARAA